MVRPKRRSDVPSKSERERALRLTPPAGDTNRSVVLGAGDPRVRRGAQEPQQFAQRYDRTQFTLTAENRVQVELVDGQPLRAMGYIADRTGIMTLTDLKLNEILAALRAAGLMETT